MNKETARTLQTLDQLWAKLKDHSAEFNDLIDNSEDLPTIQMQYLVTRICAIEMSLFIDHPKAIEQRAEATKDKPYIHIVHESAQHLIELFRHRSVVACVTRHGLFVPCLKHRRDVHIHIGTTMFLFVDCELKLRELGDLDVLNEYET